MKNKQLNTLFDRLVFLFLVHLIFKIGDQSINVFSEFTFRGFVFSTYLISYWLIVWYIAEYLNKKIQSKQNLGMKFKKIYTVILFTFNLIFGLVVSFFAYYLYRLGDIAFFDMWDAWTVVPILNPEMTISFLIFYMMVFTFDSYYNANIKIKEDQYQLEKLKRENTLAQYLNLKSQIEPHFLFNSLSVLSSVIHTDTNLASEFTLRLSRILRYVIEKNELLLVPLKDEISFIDNYLFLMQTRFIDEIIFENKVDDNLVNGCYVPPSSLQLLIENAIKHNKFTTENPLRIQLFNEGETLIVRNNLNLRNDIENSTRLGLDNLSGRYSHFCEKPVDIKQTDIDFTVSIPILTKEHYERFNI